ncbi:MAG: hypothetical protein ACFFCW_48260 [Candidatus Hodarchaeota archaeon]
MDKESNRSLSREERRKNLGRRTRLTFEIDQANAAHARQLSIEKAKEGRLKNPKKYKWGKRAEDLESDKPVSGTYPFGLKFVQIPFEMLVGNTKFSPTDMCLYSIIERYTADDCQWSEEFQGLWLVNKGVADHLKISREWVIKSLRKLETHGLIERIDMPGKYSSGRTYIATRDFSKIAILRKSRKKTTR